MNKILKKIISHVIIKYGNSKKPSKKKIEHAYFDTKVAVKNCIFITLGIFMAAFGLKGFLLPNMFVDGGIMGVSLLVSFMTEVRLSILVVIFNIPFLIFGYKVVNKMYAIRSVVAISALALCIYFIKFPIITNDKLLIAVFGGFFLGAGIGLTIRGNAVIDGTELLAIYLSRKFGFTIGDIIWIINVIIFSFAAFLLSTETALYSILTYMAASKTVDFIIDGIEEYMAVTVVSKYSENIRLKITRDLGRSVTMFSGKGGYGENREDLKNCDILYSVVTRLEINKLTSEILKIDPNAFVTIKRVKEIKGGMIKKRTIKDF
ncbi:MAG: YitT family protein [Pseudomonadota bacterium]